MTRPTKPGARLSFRPSHADTKRAIQTSLAHLAAASGMPTPMEQLSIATAKPKRERGPNKPRTADMGKPESVVQKECLEYLCRHPRVHLAIRINSGAIQSDKYYVEFNRIYLPAKYRVTFPESPRKMRIPDVLILMDDARLFACEIKKEFWYRSHGTSEIAVREQEQWNFLEHVRAAGGIGIFACNVDEVRGALIAAGYSA